MAEKFVCVLQHSGHMLREAKHTLNMATSQDAIRLCIVATHVRLGVQLQCNEKHNECGCMCANINIINIRHLQNA